MIVSISLNVEQSPWAISNQPNICDLRTVSLNAYFMHNIRSFGSLSMWSNLHYNYSPKLSIIIWLADHILNRILYVQYPIFPISVEQSPLQFFTKPSTCDLWTTSQCEVICMTIRHKTKYLWLENHLRNVPTHLSI